MNGNFEQENAPRVPDNAAAIPFVSRQMDYFSSELYRRRDPDGMLCGHADLTPLPDDLAEWQICRRRILREFEQHVYGAMPPPPDHIVLKLLNEKNDALDNTAIRREIRVYCCMNNGRQHDFDLLVYLPKNARKVPVFVGLNFDGNQANTPEMDVRMTRGATRRPGCWWRFLPPTETMRNVRLDSWNFAEAIRRGYAVATASYGEIFPDNPFGFAKSIYRLFHSDEELVESPPMNSAPREYGAITAWAWGNSRILDALTQGVPEIDTGRAAVIGHSRLGKAALWCGVNDERFKLVISNNSGCMGAAPNARKFGERFEHTAILHRFWFNENLVRFAFGDEKLPVDQHELLALIAPRTLYVASSSEDSGADPRGEFLAAQAAGKVWQLYGLRGLDQAELPAENLSCGSGVRYHIKNGNHSITATDWQHYYACADQIFRADQP